jgi:pimeloyl-ACP methyl ester carboxylesterase
MISRSLSLALLLPIWAGAQAAAPQPLTFSSPDGVSLAADWYADTSCPKDLLILVAPGFAQHSRLGPMQALCSALTPTADICCLDFRGTGRSSGWYWFGSREYRDLEPALDWAGQHYRGVALLGISLGAYSSLRAASLWPAKIKRLLLVSCPTKLEDIILSGGVFSNAFAFVFRQPQLQIPAQANLWFRWGPLFAPKPAGTELAKALMVPVDFLVGGKDRLVYPSLSRKVYDSVPGSKTWTEFPDGPHGEALFLQDPPAFVGWVKAHLP